MGIAPQIELSSLGMADSLILMVMALVVFGPRRLPQIGRQIGKLMYEFRKASNDFKFQMEEELRLSEEADRRKKEEAQRAQIAVEAAPAAPALGSGIESPYPGEGVYPPPVGLSVEMPAAASTDETPHIQPPSTGETVAAKTADVLDPMGQVEQPAGPAAAAKNDAPATEAVGHNG